MRVLANILCILSKFIKIKTKFKPSNDHMTNTDLLMQTEGSGISMLR